MVLDRLESLVESVVDGFFGVVFRGKIQPVEIARRLTRQAEEEKIISLNRVYVPNRFHVGLHPSDMAMLSAVAPELEAEFQRFVGQWVVERDYTVSGPVRVQLEARERVGRGHMRILSSLDELPGEVGHPALPDSSSEGSIGCLEGLEGPDRAQEFVLYARRMTVGRAPDCDIRLSDPGAAPYHAVLEPGDGFWSVETLEDAQTRVNGIVTQVGTLHDGDTLRLGNSVFRMRLLDENAFLAESLQQAA